MRENFDLQLFLNKSINRQKSKTLFEQIYQKIREAILIRRLRVGAKLPATRLLAKDLKVSRNTVMAVYDQLIAEGYLNGKLSSGTFVAEEIPDDLLEIRTQNVKTKQLKTSSRNISKRGKVYDKLNFAFSSAPNEQIVLTDFIKEGHFGRHIRRMRSLYAECQKILLQSISESLGEYLEVEKNVAGRHIMAWLKNGLHDIDVTEKALEYGV